MKWDSTSIRRLEHDSIKSFVQSVEFHGAVLDYGCGKRPYETHVVGCGATYYGYDRPWYPASTVSEEVGLEAPLDVWRSVLRWDMILCTQVIQYVPDPPALIHAFATSLPRTGRLVLTYPTCWDEVEREDLWRFTREGMELLLAEANLEPVRHERRAAVELGGFNFPLGYGVVAQPA